MEPITYRNLKTDIRGINDKFGEQEQRTNDLCKQIFERYGYNPVTPRNFDNDFSEGTDYGIDDVIYVNKIPLNDPFNLKRFKNGKWDDTVYTIDYKSNNLYYLNSIYVKLMVDRSFSYYSVRYTKSGKLIDPVQRCQEKDKKRWKFAHKNGKDHIFSEVDKYYGNRWILSDTNKTEYFFYVKHTTPKDPNDTALKLAYLVPAQPLREQVANILNMILKKGNYNHFIKMEHDFYLNHKIKHAFKMCKGEKRKFNQIELFKPSGKKDIMLRIPESLLVSYIKFNEYGDIIDSS